jgi:hypothetical protein
MMEEIRVSRSGVRMWLLALGGVPMVVIGIDLLMRRRIFGVFSSIVFLGDPQLVEPRDVIWAVVFLILGIIFLAFGLRELVVPVPVLVADARGLHLHLGHPLSRPVTIPWMEVDDIGAEDLDDDGSVIPVFWVKVSNPEALPANPWGARWIENDTLALMAADWEQSPRMVALAATEIAVKSPQSEDVETGEVPLPESEEVP